MAALTFEKKVLSDLKKPVGLSKMAAMRKALADLAKEEVPKLNVSPALYECAEQACKKR